MTDYTNVPVGSFINPDCINNTMWLQSTTAPVNNFLSWQSVNHIPTVPFQFQATTEDKLTACTRKRKSVNFDSDDYPKPTKIFVNEERMSAKMGGLQLDNNNVDFHPDMEQQPWYSHHASVSTPSTSSLPVNSAVPKSQKSLSNKVFPESARLEFCPELQLGVKTKEILPQVILDELSKHTMQIVLWQPPVDFVRDIMKGSTEMCPTVNKDEIIKHHLFGQSMDDDTLATVDSDGVCSETVCDQMDL